MSSPRLASVFALAALTAVVVGVSYSYASDGLMALLLSNASPADKVAGMRLYFEAWGPLAPLMYFLLVLAEVIIAPIPGTLVYLPGGAIFGGALGGALSLAGNVCGAGIACQLARSCFGPERLESLAKGGKLQKYQDMIQARGLWIIALLRVNPITSSDLVSYAAGLTRIPVRLVMLGTLIGMAPLCFAQSYFAAELFDWFPWLIWPLLVACVLYLLMGIRAIYYLNRLVPVPVAADESSQSQLPGQQGSE